MSPYKHAPIGSDGRKRNATSSERQRISADDQSVPRQAGPRQGGRFSKSAHGEEMAVASRSSPSLRGRGPVPEPVALDNDAAALDDLRVAAQDLEFRILAFPPKTDVEAMLAHAKVIESDIGQP
jgi:hypothetical protein